MKKKIVKNNKNLIYVSILIRMNIIAIAFFFFKEKKIYAYFVCIIKSKKFGVYTTLVCVEEIWVNEGPKGPIPI